MTKDRVPYGHEEGEPMLPGTEPSPEEALRMASETHEKATAARIAAWWRRASERQIERTVPKALEYGAGDLVKIGRDTLQMVGYANEYHNTSYISDGYCIEVGILWYLNGKVARALEAVKEGRAISDDTWFDIGVYAMMAQYAREKGQWP